MVRLRRVSSSSVGWTRRRAGRGFVYLDAHGERLDAEDVERIRALVIPPAWRDVWICPLPHGHLQAVGIDDAGRKQYLYHPAWRIRQDELKFARVVRAARRLPRLRALHAELLAGDDVGPEFAAATAVRLLDLGYFRIGSDAYAEGGSFGLTTLERRHVRRRGDALVFDFVGKSGVEHHVVIDDPLAVRAVEVMRRRRGGSGRLLTYRNGRGWADLDAAAVNAHLREVTGEELTAKDFRTWHATVIAAAALAERTDAATRTARATAVRQAVAEVADYLGNTPTVARSSYVDPRVIDLYEGGVTIATAVRTRHRSAERRQVALEHAVRRLLRD
ncbi:MAG: DNA topoisomerase IB [Nocardioidaceae bacterium]